MHVVIAISGKQTESEYGMKQVHGLLMVMLILLSIMLPQVQPAMAAKWCDCVEYVKAKIGTKDAVGHAKDMGSWLKRKNWRESSTPTVGAIVVMQPSFPGADTTYGHVGFVSSVRAQGNKWVITVRGANQWSGGNPYTDGGCNNVRLTGWSAFDKNKSGIKFYTR